MDEALLEKAKKGDDKSFEQIYSQIYKDLYRYAYYLLGSSEDAEDVVSDTVLDVYCSLSKLRDNSSFMPWVLKILSNKCSKKRGEYINKTVEIDENIEVSDNKSMSLEKSSSTKIDLINKLNELNDDEKKIVMLSAVYGYNSSEIGEILLVKATTIRSKLNRALQKLRERLEY